MGYPLITWTPRGDGSARTVSWDGIGVHVKNFKGGPGPSRTMNVTTGGRAVTQLRDVARLWLLEMEGIRPSRGSTWRTFVHNLEGWWEHAAAGGEFAITMNSALVASTTVGAISQGDTVIDGCASTSAFTAGEKVYFEDANDKTRHASGTINTKDSGTQVTLYDALNRSFVSGSVMRSYDYLPTAVCLEEEFPLRQRDGGRGVDMWDLSMRLRSVR